MLFFSLHLDRSLVEKAYTFILPEFTRSFDEPKFLFLHSCAAAAKNLRVNALAVVPVIATLIDPCRGEAVGHIKQDP